MTLEQKIRNSGETGVIGVEYTDEDNSVITVLEDYEGVLKCEIILDGGFTITRYLNGDVWYPTQEAAFNEIP